MITTPDTFIDGGNRIQADILDRFGNKVGPGPLVTCLGLECDTLLSQAGNFTARFPANDPRLQYLQIKKHLLVFYYDSNFIFFALTENSSESIDSDGQRIVTISGRDTLGTLDETSIDFTQFNIGASPITFAPSLVILAYNTRNPFTQWSTNIDFDTDTAIYTDVAGEPALSVLARIAESINESFRLAYRFAANDYYTIEWLQGTNPSSGVRAIQGAGDAVAAENNPNICFIQQLTERRNSAGIINKIIPFGSGLGATRLDLSGATRSAPPGFTYNTSEGSLQSDAALAYIGSSLTRHINFKDIRPLFNTDADILSAKNYLFDAALAYLQRNDDINDAVEYSLEVLQLPRSVYVGTTLRVVYQDDRYDLDTDLVVLGIRTSIGSDGAATYSLTVSPINQWRLRETNNQVSEMEVGQIFAAHSQIDANSYWKSYKEWIGDDQIDHLAEFPFFLSAEVLTIRQVLFRYKVEQILAAYATYTLANVTGLNAAVDTGDTAVTVTLTGATDITPTAVTVTTTGATDITPTAAGTSGSPTYAVNDFTDFTGDANTDDGGTARQAGGSSDTGLTAGGPTDGALSTNPTNHLHTITTTHSHTGGIHYHNITNTHRHHAPDHTHTITSTHDHAITAEHGHTSPTHDHAITAEHGHTSPNHHHGSPQHTHPLPSLVGVFGLQRIPALNSYVLADLEYSVNGGGWTSLSTGIPVAGGYYELDVTGLIQNPAGLKRPYQEDNIVQVRRSTAAGAGKSAQIRVELGIRCTIQSIVTYS